MKLGPGNWTIRLSGSTDRYLTESLRRSDGALAYLLDRLFMGEEVAVEELESWGLKVEKVE